MRLVTVGIGAARIDHPVARGYDAAVLVHCLARLLEAGRELCVDIGKAHVDDVEEGAVDALRSAVGHLAAAAAALGQVPPALDPVWERRPPVW